MLFLESESLNSWEDPWEFEVLKYIFFDSKFDFPLCLENNLQEDLCKNVINNMIKCCAQDEARSIPQCSGFLKLIQKQQTWTN
jgi:hypothetical protein